MDMAPKIPIVTTKIKNGDGDLVDTPIVDPMGLISCVLQNSLYGDALLEPAMPIDRIGPPHMSRNALSSPVFGQVKYNLVTGAQEVRTHPVFAVLYTRTQEILTQSHCVDVVQYQSFLLDLNAASLSRRHCIGRSGRLTRPRHCTARRTRLQRGA